MAKTRPSDDDSKDFALACARVCDERKGEGLKVLDVRKALPVADYFVIATGRNKRHLRAIADELRRMARERARRPPREEGGAEGGRWLLVDFGDVVVHLFDDETRRFYDVDGLWADAPLVKA